MAQAEDFQRGGFLVLPRLLAAADLASVREAVDGVLCEARAGACERPNNTLTPLRWNDPLVGSIVGDGRRISRAIGANDLRWISGYVSVKEPNSPPLWWHTDWWCWDHPVSFRNPAPQVALLLYVCDTDGSTGALRVIPGSHVRSVPLHAALPEAHGSDAAALHLDHAAMSEQADQVTVELHAGDAVVIDYRLLHGTCANTGGDRRDCVLLSFAPSWKDLPPDLRGHLIGHPALPGDDERSCIPGGIEALLPSYQGERRDLPLNRNAPRNFEADRHGTSGSPSTSRSTPSSTPCEGC